MLRTSMSELIIKKISKKFGNNTLALNNLSLNIPADKIYGILGPNGSGKSTLLRIIANIMEPDSGIIYLKDGSENHQIISKNKIWAKKNIRYCPQQHINYDFLTIEESLVLLSELNDIPKKIYETRINEFLIKLQLDNERKKKAKNLSGGQKKRLSIIMAILTVPKIILLDEPFAGLDFSSRKIIKDYIQGFLDQNTTVIIATHSFHEIRNFCDNFALIKQGNIIFSGNKEKLSKVFPLKENTEFEEILL